jgi:alpha-tubulin suppressor-like RCC1 family protein
MINRRMALFSIGLLLGCQRDQVTDPLATAQLQIVSGDQQSAGIASPLPQPVTVKLTNASGAPLPGVDIAWVVLEGGGSVDSVRTVTDLQGLAAVHWQVGSETGPQSLLASTRTASIAIHARSLLKFVAVTAGFRHTCAIATNKEAYCWGDNARGQLGSALSETSARPLVVSGHLQFAQISAGWFHTCGVTTSGEVYCWGENTVGQLGSAGPSTSFPRPVAATEKFKIVSAGYQHTCAVATSGVLYCWGNDDSNQLGDGGIVAACPTVTGSRCTAVPVAVGVSTHFVDVSAGEFHTCGVGTDSLAYCWGSSSNGQTGVGAPASTNIPAPVRISSNHVYRAIGAGSRHTCATQTNAPPDCWGRNAAGENGLTPPQAVSFPVAVTTALRFNKIDGGETTSCGLNETGVYCWGSELGNGTVAGSRLPTLVSLPQSVQDLGVGFQHVCAVAASDIWCWGSNSNNQLGVSGTARSNVPVRAVTE